MKKAIIIIDMQNDFIDGSLGTKEAAQIVAPLAEFLAAETTEGASLIFTQDTHAADYLQTSEGKKLPVEHCLKPQKGWEICEKLQPFAKAAQILEKPTFGCTALPALLSGYDELIFCGVCTDICVISNVLIAKAHYPEKKIAVKAALCAGVTPESHANALNAMKMCQIDII